MHLKFWVTLTLLAISPICVVRAGTASTATTERFEQRWVSATSTVHHARVMAVQDAQSGRLDIGVRINAGYYDDPKDFDGLAHLVEHLVVEGTLKPYPEPLHDWTRQSQSRQLHCQTFENHTNCFVSAEIGEARELMERVATALAPKQYSAADIDKQLQDIDGEQGRFASSDSGVITAYESMLVNPLHPAFRNFSSGGTQALKHAVPADLLAAAQAFLAEHYWGREADIVLIGPWSTTKTLEFARRHLLTGFGTTVRGTRVVTNASALPFGESQTALLHESPRSASADLVVFSYALPIPGSTIADSPERFRAFDLLQFMLQDLGPRSLYADLAGRFQVQSMWIEAIPGKYGNADCLRFEIERRAQSAANVDEIHNAINQFLHALESRGRNDTVRHYQAAVGLDGLIGHRPNRDVLVFDALDELDSDRGNGAFDYRAEVFERDWSAYQALLSTVQSTQPVRVLFKSSAPGVAANDGGFVATSSSVPTPDVELNRIAAAADCIATTHSSTRNCLSGLWAVNGIRSAQPFADPLQRTVGQALLWQTQQTLTARAPELSQYGNSLEVVAGASPAIGFIGHGQDATALLRRAWNEFLRQRTTDELKALQRALAYKPDNAFDWSMDAASDGLSITNRPAARDLVADSTLKQEIERLQRTFRSAPTQQFESSTEGKPTPVVAENTSVTAPLRIQADTSFRPGTLLEMHCARPTSELLAMLRVVALPSHKLLLNAARATGDPAAFGAYAVREWGADKCYGISMDSGVLDGERLRGMVSTLATERDRQFCSMSAKTWEVTKLWALASEGLPWANEQAYAVEDLRNWMQYGAGLLPARSILDRAASLSPQRVCSWVKTEGAARESHTRSIEIDVPLTH